MQISIRTIEILKLKSSLTHLRLILFDFNNIEYSSAGDNAVRAAKVTIVTKIKRGLSLDTYNSHCSFRKTSDRKILREVFFYLVGSLFCKRHIVCRRIPMSKPNGHRIAIGVLNAQSQGVDLRAGIPYLCQMNEFAGVSSDNKLFCPPGQTPKVMWGQTISVGNSWSRQCRFKLPIWHRGQQGNRRNSRSF